MSGPCLAVQRDLWEAEPGVFADLEEDYPECPAVPVEGREQALELLDLGRAALAIVSGEPPERNGQLLRQERFVLATHVTSPLHEFTVGDVRELFTAGGQWLPVVVGDGLGVRELLHIDHVASTSVRASSWSEAKELVMANRGVVTLLPWELVDFRVRALMVTGQPAIAGSLDVGVFEREWRLVGALEAWPLLCEDLQAKLARDDEPLVSLLAVGDVMLGRGIASLMAANTASYPFLGSRELTRGTDLTFGNLECAITSGGKSQGGFALRAGPEAAPALAEAGFDILSLANNHADDYGNEGLADTVRYLQNEGIAYVGWNPQEGASVGPVVLERRGLRIAFLAFNHVGRPEAMGDGAGPDWLDTGLVYEEVRRAAEDADFVVVSLHWGAEYIPLPDAFQQQVARAIVNAGAGLVLGHHAHVVGTVSFEDQGLAIYSLGNYVFDQPFSVETLQGLALWALVDSEGLRQVRFLPVQIVDGQPIPLPRAEANAVLSTLFQASETVGGLPSSPGEAVETAPRSDQLDVEWVLSLSSQVTALRLHDLDGDARLEIVAADGPPGGPNCVQTLDEDRSVRWKYCTEQQINDLECGDLDGDMRAEVVVATGLLDRPGEILALDAEGRRRWRYGVEAGVLDIALGSMDGDSTLEVAAGEWGAFGDTVYLLDGQGKLRWMRPTRGSVHSVAVGDVQQDGIGDVLAGAEDLYVLGGKGALLWRYATAGYVDQVGLASLNENGRKRVFAATSYPDPAVSSLDPSGNLAWRYELDASPTVVLAADLEGDARQEVLVGALDGSLYLLDSGGTLRWKQPLSGPISDLALDDLDGDSVEEIVVGTGDHLTPGTVCVLDCEAGAILACGQGMPQTTFVEAGHLGQGDSLMIVAASGNKLYSLRWAGHRR